METDTNQIPIDEAIITYTRINSPYEYVDVIWKNEKHSVKWSISHPQRAITWNLHSDLKLIDEEAVLDIIGTILDNIAYSAPVRPFKPSTVHCIRHRLGWKLPMYDNEGLPLDLEALG